MQFNTSIKERIQAFRIDRDEALSEMLKYLIEADVEFRKVEERIVGLAEILSSPKLYKDGKPQIKVRVTANSSVLGKPFRALDRCDFYLYTDHKTQEHIPKGTRWDKVIEKHVKRHKWKFFRKNKKSLIRTFSQYNKAADSFELIWKSLSTIVKISETSVIPSIHREHVYYLSGRSFEKAYRGLALRSEMIAMLYDLVDQHHKHDAELGLQLAIFNTRYSWNNKAIAFHWELARRPVRNKLKNIKGVRAYYISKPFLGPFRQSLKTPLFTLKRDADRKKKLSKLNREFLRDKKLHSQSWRILSHALKIKKMAESLDKTIQSTLLIDKQIKNLHKILGIERIYYEMF